MVAAIALLIYFTSDRKGRLLGSLIALLANAFVLWKTIIFLLYDWQYASEAVRTFQM